VPGDDGAGEPVPVVARPAELPGRRTERERGVGDAPADHDVGAAFERGGDAPAAEVRVRGDDRRVERGERDALVEVRERLARRAQRIQARQEVVALDVGDRGA
jgi:hypothetical protein